MFFISLWPLEKNKENGKADAHQNIGGYTKRQTFQSVLFIGYCVGSECSLAILELPTE